MTVNPQDPMNTMMRQAGNRTRAIPNIGQQLQVQPQPQPAPQATPQAIPQAPAPPPMAQPMPTGAPSQLMGRPENPLSVHPPGVPANAAHYNYEPTPDGGFKVYPPGVPAPDGAVTVSSPRAASTNDYARIRQIISQPSF